MARLSGRGLPRSYSGKLRMLRGAGIALWDVVESCERAGALDADIRDPRPADVPGLLRRYPGIRRVFVTGRTGALLYERFFGDKDCPRADYLPSPSPAYAALSFERKAAVWEAAISPALKP